MSNESDPTVESPSSDNTCRVSTWFFRRMAMLILLTGGLGLYFLYDGMVGYPKKNFTVSLYESFESGQDGKEFDSATYSAEKLSEEKVEELRRANEAGQNGATWAGFAADRMLPEKVPERYTEADIKEQFRFAVIMGVIALAILGFCLWQRTRTYRYTEEQLVLPNGETLSFSDIEELDLEKWDRGIARLTCSADAEEKKSIRLDDYKYSGMGKFLLHLVESKPEIEVKGDRRWLEVTATGEATEESSIEESSEEEGESPPEETGKD